MYDYKINILIICDYGEFHILLERNRPERNDSFHYPYLHDLIAS